MAKLKKVVNKYKQTAYVEKDEEPERPWSPPPKPTISKGDMARCTLFSVHYDINSPTKVIDVLPDSGYNSGWRVLVDTKNKGVISLDSSLFIIVKSGQ
jgi:hypothetical protein